MKKKKIMTRVHGVVKVEQSGSDGRYRSSQGLPLSFFFSPKLSLIVQFGQCIQEQSERIKIYIYVSFFTLNIFAPHFTVQYTTSGMIVPHC